MQDTKRQLNEVPLLQPPAACCREFAALQLHSSCLQAKHKGLLVRCGWSNHHLQQLLPVMCFCAGAACLTCVVLYRSVTGTASEPTKPLPATMVNLRFMQ
jgi:hypothetical protein